MGDSESKTWPDEKNRPQIKHDPVAERQEVERLVREMQRKLEEEIFRNIMPPMPTSPPPPYEFRPQDLFGVDPQAYEEWRRDAINGRIPKRKGFKPIDPIQVPEHVMEQLRKSLPPSQRPNGLNPKHVIVDEMEDMFGYLGDYPHMDLVSRKQEKCRHHPINVGFNTDKWVCKICDKDLDEPVDNIKR